MTDRGEAFIPVVDCPECGRKDVALNVHSVLSTNREDDIWYCPYCSCVEGFGEPKRHITLREMEELDQIEGIDECDSW